jgi:hypothetical protein
MSVAADREIADLNMSLAEDGEWIEVRRFYGTQMIPVSVTCRAFVRGINAEELAAGISQDNANVTISPSEIIAAGWPGPWTPTPSEPVNPGTDRRVPKKGDACIIKGRKRTVEVAKPIYVDDELVRINMRVLG